MQTEFGGYEISNDRERLDIDLIHRFLNQDSYWARGIPRPVVAESIRNSLCFGVYDGSGKQVGFARVVTDHAVIAYLADVFIVPEHRGRGVSKFLMGTILAHPRLQGLRRWMLATFDAHGLYQQFGYRPLANPEYWMEIADLDLYTRIEPRERRLAGDDHE